MENSPVLVLLVEAREMAKQRPEAADCCFRLRLGTRQGRPKLLETQARSPARRRNSQIQQESAPLRPAMFALPE